MSLNLWLIIMSFITILLFKTASNKFEPKMSLVTFIMSPVLLIGAYLVNKFGLEASVFVMLLITFVVIYLYRLINKGSSYLDILYSLTTVFTCNIYLSYFMDKTFIYLIIISYLVNGLLFILYMVFNSLLEHIKINRKENMSLILLSLVLMILYVLKV